MYSNTHLACFSGASAIVISDSMPFSGVMVITSPGSISLTNSAPIVSSAQVSDVTIYALSLFPMQRGLKPNGSLAAISFLGLSTTSA